MKLLIIICSVFMLSIPLHSFAQMSSRDIVDDGGSLRISPTPPPQNLQQGQQQQGALGQSSQQRSPARGGTRAGDSTAVQLPPQQAAEIPTDMSQDQLMQEYEKHKDKLPPGMRNLSPEQLMEQYKKLQGR